MHVPVQPTFDDIPLCVSDVHASFELLAHRVVSYIEARRQARHAEIVHGQRSFGGAGCLCDDSRVCRGGRDKVELRRSVPGGFRGGRLLFDDDFGGCSNVATKKYRQPWSLQCLKQDALSIRCPRGRVAIPNWRCPETVRWDCIYTDFSGDVDLSKDIGCVNSTLSLVSSKCDREWIFGGECA